MVVAGTSAVGGMGLHEVGGVPGVIVFIFVVVNGIGIISCCRHTTTTDEAAAPSRNERPKRWPKYFPVSRRFIKFLAQMRSSVCPLHMFHCVGLI